MKIQRFTSLTVCDHHLRVDGQAPKRLIVEENILVGKALTLQIGDTADSYNQLKVDVKNMHAASLCLDKIRIDDQAQANQMPQGVLQLLQ